MCLGYLKISRTLHLTLTFNRFKYIILRISTHCETKAFFHTLYLHMTYFCYLILYQNYRSKDKVCPLKLWKHAILIEYIYFQLIQFDPNYPRQNINNCNNNFKIELYFFFCCWILFALHKFSYNINKSTYYYVDLLNL